VRFGAEALPRGRTRPAAGSGAWAAPAAGATGSGRAPHLPARQCPRAADREEYAAYSVAGLSDKLANVGG
jgi:hypothetical protein